MANEVAGLLWSERDLTGCSLTNIRLKIEFFDLESMSNILTSQHDHYRLSFLQRDLGWGIRKALRHHLDSSRWVRRRCSERKGSRPHPHYATNGNLANSFSSH